MFETSNVPAKLVVILADLSHQGTPNAFHRQSCRCASGVAETIPVFLQEHRGGSTKADTDNFVVPVVLQRQIPHPYCLKVVEVV